MLALRREYNHKKQSLTTDHSGSPKEIQSQEKITNYRMFWLLEGNKNVKIINHYFSLAKSSTYSLYYDSNVTFTVIFTLYYLLLAKFSIFCVHDTMQMSAQMDRSYSYVRCAALTIWDIV